jgi:predicted PurR-regulated permease PerM
MAAEPTTSEALAVKDARSVPRLGVWAWSFVGVVAATVIVVAALGAVSEIMLPLVFAAVLAVVFKPLVGQLERRGLKPTFAAGMAVLGLAALMTVVMVATVRGVLQQTDQIGDSVDAALANASASLMSTRSRSTMPGRRPRGRRRRSRAGSSPRWFPVSMRWSAWRAA